MPGKHPPTYFVWPAPIYGFCPGCGAVETAHGWEEVPWTEKAVLYRQNIQWILNPCSLVCEERIDEESQSEGSRPKLRLVASAG